MATFIRWIGNLTLLAGFTILFLTFAPLAVQEVSYRVRPSDYYTVADEPSNEVLNINPEKRITPVDEKFGIIIPKINANSSIIRDVDPNNSKTYQTALAKGVAHAQGTSVPTETGNMFLFSHSAGNFWEVSKYNTVFYLLNKLEVNDEILIYFNEQKFHYQVTNKTVVDPSEVEYLQKKTKGDSLTLMTCWPPGTTLKRLIVEAVKD